MPGSNSAPRSYQNHLGNQPSTTLLDSRLQAPDARELPSLEPVVCSLSPVQSERLDLNQRSPGPRPGAITRLRYVLIEYPVGELNASLRRPTCGRCPKPAILPLDERGMLSSARTPCASEPGDARRPTLRVGARVCGSSDRRRPCCAWCPHLSYQPIKKTRCRL